MIALEERLREAEQRLFARYAVHPDERMLELRGGALHLRLLEYGAGEPVLLLHPGGWLGSVWAPLAQHLPGRRLIGLDLPGHGLSDGIDFRREPARAGVVAMLREVFAALGLSRAPVVANSIGGVFALWLAADAGASSRRSCYSGRPARRSRASGQPWRWRWRACLA